MQNFPTESSSITINGAKIRVDQAGLYSVNDLHQASGGEKRHSPHEWLKNKKTQELAAEIKKTSIPVIQSKQGFGTYVCKELVYSYAMWINAAFHLQVIRTFDEVATTARAALPQTFAQALRLAAEQQEQIERQQTLLEEQKPTVQAFERIAVANDSVTMTEAAKSLQMSPSELMGWLSTNGWIYRRVGAKAWSAYQDKINAGLMEHKVTVVEREDGTEKMVNQARITPKGLTRLAKIFAEGGAA